MSSAVLIAVNEALLGIAEIVRAPAERRRLIAGWAARGRRGLETCWDDDLKLSLYYDLRAAKPLRCEPWPRHLKAVEETEREGIPGLVEVLREEGLDAVRNVLRDATGWHRDYSPPAWRNRATADQKRKVWEMAV